MSIVSVMSAAGAIMAILLVSACNLGVPDPVVGAAPQQISERFIPEPPGYRLENWIADLEAPWSLVFMPDGGRWSASGRAAFGSFATAN